MADWIEHVAGPMNGPVLQCSRCFEVLWVRPEGSTSKTPFAQPGERVASDGQHPSRVTGWPYTACTPWQPKVGDVMVRPGAVRV